MRRAALLALVLSALVLSALSFAPAPASAGGPTSVLVTVPGEGRSTALYYTNTAYDQLWEALGVGDEVRPARDVPDDVRDGSPVVLTWLIHDVTVWRVDQVYVHDDTTYVLTQENVGGGPLAEGASVLHEAGPELLRILDRVLPTENGYLQETRVEVDPAPRTQPAPELTATRPAAAPVERTSPLLLAAAGLGGLLAGVVGTLSALAVRRPRNRFVCGAPA
jgi:hypothetical protein